MLPSPRKKPGSAQVMMYEVGEETQVYYGSRGADHEQTSSFIVHRISLRAFVR